MSNDTQPEIRFPGFTDEWEQRKLGELATIVRGASPRPIQDPKWFDTESDVGWLRIADVTEQDGRIYYLEQHISKLGQEKTRVLVEPHLLLSIAATVGKPVVNYVKTGVHDGFLIFLNAIFDREFMFQWLEMFRPKWQKYGQPGSQVNLNSELVRNQEILIPNNEEQQKIGSFFKQLDDTIALHQRKLDLLKETKKGFLQKMFPKNGAKVPEIRFPGFTKDWEERKLGDVFSERSERSSEGELISVTINSGVIKASELDRKDNSSDNKSNYKKVEVGDIAYNSMRMWQGASGYSSYEGILSPAYTVIIPKEGTDSKFFAYDFKRYDMIQTFKRNSQGLTSDTWNLKFPTLKLVKIMVPSIEEQKQIAAFFERLDNTIALHERELDVLKETKKGFLQKMFV
ncbi:restriction endonuclease subunit S [Enterococcus faecium]|uniref:restriction endonuclease subunit S n=1 Tax=Enterococcus faecium TaxID=1352 RepID=UPI00100F4E7E|nr:restriction endonuclease subunit S [Enterococcus faecium]MCD5095584.1 restriction endonuclease subunit S [Enterococcus faecium]RXW86042.1 restriction endonuclease subunit S [Enterococcus faecium]